MNPTAPPPTGVNGWLLVILAVIAIIPATIAAVSSWRTHKAQKESSQYFRQEVATSNGYTLGQLVEQQAKDARQQKEEMSFLAADMTEVKLQVGEVFIAMARHLADHLDDNERHVERRAIPTRREGDDIEPDKG